MTNRTSPAASLLFGAAVVALSGLAAWFGASLAQRDAAAPSSAGPASLDAERLEALARRIGELEDAVQLADQNARTALELARAKAETPPATPAETVPPQPGTERSGGTADPAPLHPPDGPPDRDDGADGQMGRLRAIQKVTSEGRVVHAMSLYTDATKEGAANRFAQANADATAVLYRYGLRGEDVEAKVKQAFVDEWERGAREIGPIVHDGLAKADIATVRERLRASYAKTDEALRPSFDAETWKLYEEAAAGWRRANEAVLDEYEKKRLGLK